MNIQLGNLDLKDIVEEDYLKTVQEFLDTNGYRRESVCDKVDKVEGNYHIFDIPRLVSVCGKEKMEQFIKFLQDNDLVGKFKGQVGVTYQDLTPTPITNEDNLK